MKTAKVLALALGCAMWLAASGPQGTVPRTAAWRYPAHGKLNGVTVGAALLTAQDAKHAFSTEVNRCCIVIEVGVYPEKDKPLDISLDNFALRVAGRDSAGKPQSAKLVAATLHKKAQTPGREVVVSPVVGVGIESGPVYDPATGQQRRATGVYTAAGVGVGIDRPQAQPGSTDRDRETMELELTEKGLPEGTTATPVAGYLYFPQLSSNKGAALQLEFTLNGNKITVRFP